jgi:putative transposase
MYQTKQHYLLRILGLVVQPLIQNNITKLSSVLGYLEVVDGHAHLFVELYPTNSLSEVVQYLKGGDAFRLFKVHPELRKRYWGGHFWSDGKFYRSVGNVTACTIRHYITEYRGKLKNIAQDISSVDTQKVKLKDG